MPRGGRAGARPAAALAGCLAALAHARLEGEKTTSDLLTGVHPTELPCLNPSKRSQVKLPDSLLLGKGVHPVMYSGYVNVTSSDYLFYVLAEAHADAGPDAPVIVWSNGGPGCSAMEGMTTEHGPLILYAAKDDEATFPGKLSENPYSWNRDAHVLYVDQPRYVGYSCGTGPFITSSEDAGEDMVSFLRGWQRLFPEHSQRKFILGSESYGGRYVSAWYSAIKDYNARASSEQHLRVSGIILGNAFVDEKVQGYSFAEFAKRQGLIPPNSAPMSSKQAREMISKYLGYQPNYYDYRLREKECCGCSSYNYKPWSNWMLREDVASALNVCGDAGTKAFGGCAAGCISLPDFDKDSAFDYGGVLGQALEDGVHVTLYYGMQDTACNYVGGYALAASLKWPGSKDFDKASFEELSFGSVDIGKLKAGGNLTYIQVDGAGHMVPISNPAAASFAIGTLLPERKGPDCMGDEARALALESKVALAPSQRRSPAVRVAGAGAGSLIAAALAGAAALAAMLWRCRRRSGQQGAALLD